MKTSFSLLLLLSLSLLPLLTSARPCKTFFISYTITTTTAAATNSDEPPSRVFTVYRVISPLPRPHHYRTHHHHSLRQSLSPSSFHDRAKDILLVVAGLLFGVGCGAITAGTIYLIWSLLTTNQHYTELDSESNEDSDEENPKKMGYVMIAGLAPPPPIETEKEGYEGK